MIIDKKPYGPDDTLSIDGSTGEVMLGEVKRSEPKFSADFGTLMSRSDDARRLGVRTHECS